MASVIEIIRGASPLEQLVLALLFENRIKRGLYAITALNAATNLDRRGDEIVIAMNSLKNRSNPHNEGAISISNENGLLTLILNANI